jgi:hypothetical protein
MFGPVFLKQTGADAFIEDAHSTIDLLFCAVASRDLIVSFQGPYRTSSSSQQRPRFVSRERALKVAPRPWLEPAD